MHIDRTVGFADWPQTEVVGPADQHPVEPCYDCLRILPDGVTSGLVADRSTDALHSLLRGYRAQTLYTESSDSSVASAAASIATGWSEPVPGRELHPLKSSAFHGALFRQLHFGEPAFIA